MFRKIIASSALILGVAFSPAAAQDAAPHAEVERILLVVSSHGREGGDAQPGYEMDELSQAWLVFSANGFDLDIASPEGGAVVADAYDAEKPYNAAFLADAHARGDLNNTLRLNSDMARDYSGIFIIGGKGAMFDLPMSQLLQSLVADLHVNGAYIGAVCHGPAVFARTQTEDGTSLVKGMSITGFTDEEEAMFGSRWIDGFPFLLESEMRKQGAQFSEALPMLPNVARDDRVVTGQNPFSVALAAEAMITAMGQTPVARTHWSDEYTMLLLQQAAGGDESNLREAIAQEDTNVELILVAVWGYYRSQQPGLDRASLEFAVDMMELGRPGLPEPELDRAIESALERLALMQDGSTE